jgi:magnesium chelatase family protein
MIATVFGSAVYGVGAQTITIEVDVTEGRYYQMVGLPDNSVKEARDRIESAMRQYGYYVPRTRLIISLAPADVRKEGSAYDLPICLGMMAATHQIPTEKLDKLLIMGELSLTGELRPIKGVLPIAIEARKQGFEGFILPKANADEAAIVNQLQVYGVESLQEAVNLLKGKIEVQPTMRDTRELFAHATHNLDADFDAVQGQENIKRALEIAAAGGHNVVMIGPPGSGKTMLARRLPGILPPLTLAEALETTKIHSVAGKLGRATSLIAARPFRSPHHTISDVALVGGGNIPQPGEISLAHNGVLFLDELPEFKRTVLEVMRQPLEDRHVSISRAKMAVEFPANFMLVASMNPCPCGFYNHPEKTCTCGPGVVQKYVSRISGPLLDRIDLHVEVTPVSFDAMTNTRPQERSLNIRERVERARQRQTDRFAEHPGLYSNAMMDARLVRKYCQIDTAGTALLKTAMERLGLSARAYERILKVGRTIADLDGQDNIGTSHLAEAIQYRSLDRKTWGEK